ncbi:Gfo/Idh/MocA family protein [Legionella bononiensis]|uniref:Gfo/Idh/MocA family oxidoreductase n=1 Tax=Legionella bononiensis TaxID=2793102 RepID=A0ABS1W7Q2_9GAMM|nr:Gfo/Idh/MocA family oxidoreductase [Legionella bononiensis]MBL7480087.1 Gfo/Idh/MocA family oxidoreductase [Legionella bononiensis]MBL7525398.1 Gfo/Idh/MocA family oxidoreductase [Legionella bononiensis]MBL7561582.1 Gfo/Idh/MocA family oxidoreductase [Legionella bononiensis]
MTGNIIRWGILGTSFISEVMAKAIQSSATSQLVAVGSRSSESANQFAQQFSISQIYDDYQRLIDAQDIDAVYIGLPNHVHKEWIIRAAYAGKHILCEKPLVLNTEEAQEVISVLAETQVFCMEALMYRCHPFTQKLEEIIQSRILGEIKLYNALYTAPIADLANPIAGGSIRNLGCYPISLIRLLAKAEPVELVASGRLNQSNHSDSQASAILKFEDTAIAVVSTADDFEMVWQFDVYGTLGSLKAVTNPWLPGEENNQCVVQLYEDKKELELIIKAEKPLYTYQIDAVNSHIMKNSVQKQNVISLADSLGNIRVLEDWLKQIN